MVTGSLGGIEGYNVMVNGSAEAATIDADINGAALPIDGGWVAGR